MLRFFCAQHGRFFHLTLIFPSHTHLSMQMVELILPVAIKTRTYTGRRGNRATFISGISHFAVWKNLWTLKLCMQPHWEMCTFEYMIMRKMTIIVKAFSAKYLPLRNFTTRNCYDREYAFFIVTTRHFLHTSLKKYRMIFTYI